MDLSISHKLNSGNNEDSIEEPNRDLLVRCLDAVNRKHFKNKIEANIFWEVPKGTVSVRENTENLTLTIEQSLCFDKAIKLVRNEDYQNAIHLLKPIADLGHRDSQLAMCHLLKRTHGDWKAYAEMHNSSVRVIQAVPAACYYPDNQIIAIHPHLFQRNVPQFVLRYLIFHECCHQVIPSDENDPHPESFMKLELQAPHRDRAILWLEKEGYPTIRSC